MKIEIIREEPSPPPVKEIILRIPISDLSAFRNLVTGGKNACFNPSSNSYSLAIQILNATFGIY